uniref:LIM zinc-binding domain-containing protein n=1 Tax=Bos indicus x Bos taurus TaxID=30522 RepID=A0A4W2BRS1_BOBOX
MASKPEKRVASSVFITLVPPRRDEAVVEEVRRAACEAQPGHPWESPAPTKAPGAGSVGKLRSWMPPGRTAAPGPAVPPPLSNGGPGGGASTAASAQSSQARRGGAAAHHSKEPVGFPERDICAFCRKTVSPRELGVEAMERQYPPSASRAVSAANGWPGRASTRRMGGPSVKPATRTPGEVCQVCKVVRERIIRALGQAFHPSCV